MLFASSTPRDMNPTSSRIFPMPLRSCFPLPPQGRSASIMLMLVSGSYARKNVEIPRRRGDRLAVLRLYLQFNRPRTARREVVPVLRVRSAEAVFGDDNRRERRSTAEKLLPS